MELPAIEGGKPAFDSYLTFGKPELTESDLSEVISVFKTGWIGTGPKCKQFEEKIIESIGCKHAIAMNSCTSALHLGLLCSGVGKGDEVIVPSLTFAASVNVIEHVGAKPIFVDVQRNSFNIDPALIEKAITPRTKAIIPVHFAGLPCDMDKINEIARKHELVVVEDAAHAIGAEFKGKKIGNSDNIVCFSFYVTKNITSIEGGLVALNDPVMAEKIRMHSLHGLSKHAFQRFTKGGSKSYDVVYPGYKYNMPDVNAALVLSQLSRVDEVNEYRKRICESYIEQFKGFDLVELPPDLSDRKSSFHLYPIMLSLEKLKISRVDFINAMDKENIGTGIHYSPIHLEPFYKNKYGTSKSMLPVTEYIGERVVSIPLQTTMTIEDSVKVANAVKRILNYYRK